MSESDTSNRVESFLGPECLWNERTCDGRTWEDMPGSGEEVKKMNFALYRRMAARQRNAWMMQSGREDRDPVREDSKEAA
ncbi:MAG TPA: hypothetical protein P5016_00240 [Verrucomicrobiales bacterium]|nr:hypothetical protein [Verrucomicrobiales bacterium]